MDSSKFKITELKRKLLLVWPYFKRQSKALLGFLFSSKKPYSFKQQDEFDKKLVYSLSKSRIPNLRQLRQIKRFLTPRELWVIRLSIFTIIISLLFWSWHFYFSHLQKVPVEGGKYFEGLIGAPQYINPLYASANNVDADLVSLLFSSLYKRDKDGNLVYDLIEQKQINGKGTEYTYVIRDNVSFSDGEPLSVDDIIFTFQAIQDSAYRSPWRNSFLGVKLEKVDKRTIKFILPQPYAAFEQLLTFGILPAAYWRHIEPQNVPLTKLNLQPIGSGPYKLKSWVADEKTGAAHSINLISNDKYYGKKPFIPEISFVFYPDINTAISALNEGKINGLASLPPGARGQIVAPNSYHFYELNQPQITALFFNSKENSILAKAEIRQALAYALPKSLLTDTVLGQGYKRIDTPFDCYPDFALSGYKKYKFNQDQAKQLLAKAGWKLASVTPEMITKAEADKNSEDEEKKQLAAKILAIGSGEWLKKDNDYFIVNLTIVESQENKTVAEFIKKYWQQIGVKVNLNIISPDQVQEVIVRHKNFEALFYGLALGPDPDPYAFWHSSQIDNGLNISGFKNEQADKILEQARTTLDKSARIKAYEKFVQIISQQVPAIFMYSKYYNYVQSNLVKGFAVSTIHSPADRFANIVDWYIKTGKKLVW